ncbi:EamA family transporter [Vibrio sp. RC27]
MKKNSYLMTVGLTAIAPIIWGSTYIVTSELLPENYPVTASTLRALPAGLILVLLTRSLPSGHWWCRLVTLAFLNVGFFFYCLFYAATHLPGGMAALVMSISPIVVIVLSYFLLKNQLNIRQLVASFFAIGSMALLLFNEQAELNVEGVVIGVFGAISMSFGIVLTKHWGSPQTMTLLGFTGWQLLLGGSMLLPLALWSEGVPNEITIKNTIGYGYLSIVGAILAYALWFNGISKLPTLTISILGFLSSLSAVLLGYIFLGQSLNLLQGVGMLGLFAAIVMVSSRNRVSAKPINVQTE